MTEPTRSEEPLAGLLQGIGVPALIRELGRRQSTGRLHLENGSVRRTIFFENGGVVFASSTDPNDRLGEHLLKRGRITLTQLETALGQQDTGKRLGTLLVEAGVLSQADLFEVVTEQIASVVHDLLQWSSGSYHFEETPPSGEDILLNIPNEQLLYRGVREIRSMSLIERGVGPPRTAYRLTEDWGKRADGLELTEGARAIVDRLAEGPASIDMLCREVCTSNFELYQTLWAFRLLGVTEPCERPGSAEFEGNLVTTGLADLLIRLADQAETGVLYLSRRSVERSLLFAAGRCVFATSSDPDDGLIHFLFRRGVISLRDKEETVRRLLSNKRVGTILRELGAIDDDDLRSMVRQQVSEIIYDTFTWEAAEFVFVPGSLPHAEEITLDGRVGTLIAEGIRRVASWTRLVRGCGGVDNPLCLTPRYLEILDEIEAGVAEWEVVNALKSPQSPRRVCATCDLDDFRICQTLWTLKLLGAIEDSPVNIEETVDEEPAATDEQAAPAAVEPMGEPVAVAAAPDAPSVEGGGSPVAEPTATRDEPSDAPAAAAPEAPPVGARWPQQEEVEQALLAMGEAGTSPEPAAPPPDLSLDEIDTESSDEAGPEDPAAAEGDALEPGPEVPEEVEATILRFNAMHRVVYRAVRSEIGAGAANFVRSCCIHVARQAPDLVEGVQLHPDGSWDTNGLKRAIVDKGIEDPWDVYQLVLDREFVALQPHLGDLRSDELKQRIWEIEQGSA
jgi:hypothetical protein